MSLTSDYLKLREERLKKEEEEKKKKKNSTTTTKASQDKPLYSSVDIAPDNPLFSFNEDIAPVLHKVNSSKKTESDARTPNTMRYWKGCRPENKSSSPGTIPSATTRSWSFDLLHNS